MARKKGKKLTDKRQAKTPKRSQPKETRAQLRKVSANRLKQILAAHKKWLETKGKQGKRADLENKDIHGLDLSEADLRDANLCGVNLQGAELKDADFRGADLHGADLQEAILLRTKLQEAILRDADLRKVKSLLGGNLAGANVTNAQLPDKIATFEGLAHAEETSKNARKIFLAMLLGCAYSWLTIATTTDARLLTNSASSPLPIIQTEIPIAGFYWTAPLILFALYAYFHLYLQRLWEGLAKLPAIFPDGRALHERAYPWLLNGLVRVHFRHLRTQRTLLSRLENAVSIVLAWWVVPFTLLWFWVRYIPRYDWGGTGLHLVLVTLSIGLAIMLHRHAVRTLRGSSAEFRWRTPWSDARTYQVVATLALAVVVWGLSYGAIEGAAIRWSAETWQKERHWFPQHYATSGPRTWVPKAFAFLGYRTYADLRQAVVSTLVTPADLSGRDLRYANARQASFVNADLQAADLRGANLRSADLRGANLSFAKLHNAYAVNGKFQSANLRNTEMPNAILEDANFENADLRAADFKAAKLRSANLASADLRYAGLQNASLARTNLEKARLSEARVEGADFAFANLKEADLRGTHGLKTWEIKEAKNWELAFYSDDFLEELGLPADHNETLEKKLAEMEKEKEKTATEP